MKEEAPQARHRGRYFHAVRLSVNVRPINLAMTLRKLVLGWISLLDYANVKKAVSPSGAALNVNKSVR